MWFLVVDSWLMETEELPVRSGKCCGRGNEPAGRSGTGPHRSQPLPALKNWCPRLRRRSGSGAARLAAAVGAQVASYKYAVVLIAGVASAPPAEPLIRRCWFRVSKLPLRRPCSTRSQFPFLSPLECDAKMKRLRPQTKPSYLNKQSWSSPDKRLTLRPAASSQSPLSRLLPFNQPAAQTAARSEFVSVLSTAPSPESLESFPSQVHHWFFIVTSRFPPIGRL